MPNSKLKTQQQLIRKRNMLVCLDEHHRITDAEMVRRLNAQGLKTTVGTWSRWLNTLPDSPSYRPLNPAVFDEALRILEYTEADIEEFWRLGTDDWRNHLNLPSPKRTLREDPSENYGDRVARLLQLLLEPTIHMETVQGYAINIIVHRIPLYQREEGVSKVAGYFGFDELDISLQEQTSGTVEVPPSERARYRHPDFPEIVSQYPGQNGDNIWKVSNPDETILGSHGNRIRLAKGDYSFQISDDARTNTTVTIQVSAAQPFSYTSPAASWRKLGMDDSERQQIESIANIWIEESWAEAKAFENEEVSADHKTVVMSRKRYLVD